MQGSVSTVTDVIQKHSVVTLYRPVFVNDEGFALCYIESINKNTSGPVFCVEQKHLKYDFADVTFLCLITSYTDLIL